MDKFGIFNLLNSFFNFNNELSPDKNGQTATETTGLSRLFSALNNSQNNNDQQTKPIVKPQPSAPLQAGMLNTMSSHDQILRRIKENANKKT